MASRIHQVKLHKPPLRGVEAMTLVSNHHFPRHSHEHFGIGVVAFGAQSSWSGVGQVSAGAGDVIMVNPGEMHDGQPLNQNPRGWRMIYLGPAMVASEVVEEFHGPIEIVRPVARDPQLARLFARLFACLTAAQPDSLAREESLLGSLVYLLRRHGVPRPAPRVAAPCVTKAIQRLNSDPAAQTSLAELAALSSVSRFQLLRGFVREVGITPHAYLIQRRVRLARRLLAEGRTPVETAAMAGFADQSHMTRAFVRQLGITPGRYRAAHA